MSHSRVRSFTQYSTARFVQTPREREQAVEIGREWISADLILGNLPNTPVTSTSTSLDLAAGTRASTRLTHANRRHDHHAGDGVEEQGYARGHLELLTP